MIFTVQLSGPDDEQIRSSLAGLGRRLRGARQLCPGVWEIDLSFPANVRLAAFRAWCDEHGLTGPRLVPDDRCEDVKQQS